MIDVTIKTKKSATRIADILAAVESILAVDGRPRKLPGKPRAFALGLWGKPINRITKRNMWDVDKVSLTAAFQLARINAGASKKQMLTAMYLFVDAYWAGPLWGPQIEEDEILDEIREIDNYQLDTRRLARDAKAARRTVEMAFPSVKTTLIREGVNA